MGRSYLPILFLVTASAFAQAPGKQALIKPKLAELNTSAADSVYVTGVWRPDNPTKKNELVEGVTELTCFRHGGEELVRTEAFCLQATATSANGMLIPSTEWLKVLRWNDAQVIASGDSSICVESQTIFDLKRKTAIALDVRKPEAKGLDNACELLPDRQTYYLQDVVDYYVHKQVTGSENSTETHAKPNATAPARAGENGIGTPACLYCPEPLYTSEAAKAKFRGSVFVQAIIQPDGHATDIHVVKGAGLGLDEKAIEAVRTWRFKPAVGPNGVPIATTTMLEVNFRLL